MVIVFSTFDVEPPLLLLLAFIEALRITLGVLDPSEQILGIDLELRLADLELCKLGVLGASEIDLQYNLGEPNRSQNWALELFTLTPGQGISSLETSDLSMEF